MSKTSVSLDSKKDSEKKVVAEKEKMSLKSLKDLLFLGRVENVISIDGIDFKLKTITAEEQRNMILKIMKMQEEYRILSAKIVTLAFSIISINNVPFESFADDGVDGDLYDKRISIVEQLQASIIDRLYNFYEKMTKESNLEVDVEELKK
jgi:hypothetical protein